MRIAIIGSGPTGLMLGAALAHRGHEVVSIDRDPGPGPDGRWPRKGVMQFEHAHAFRPQVAQLLQREWPAAYDAWVALGAEPVLLGLPGGDSISAGMRSRRSTFERALRQAAGGTPGLRLRQGHVDELLQVEGRVVGVVLDGEERRADLVVDAAGRSGRVGRPTEDVLRGDCGMSYVDRVYRLHPGAEPGPVTMPVGWVGNFDGWQNLLFLHEQGYFSVLFVRPTADHELKDLRHVAAFEAACRSVAALATWTEPGRSEPVSEVMVGGALRNVYREQVGRPGLVAVGDAVSTTTPTAGRGVAMCALQVGALLDLMDADPDPGTLPVRFGAWCDDHIRPWVEDHIAMDSDAVLRWQGHDTIGGCPLTSNQIVDAGNVDPVISQACGGYLAMLAPPASLGSLEARARAVYDTGWRMPLTEGPTRDELVASIRRALQPAGAS